MKPGRSSAGPQFPRTDITQEGAHAVSPGPLPFSDYIAAVPPPFAGLFSNFIFKPVLRPVIRVITGLVAIPVFRFLLRGVFRVQHTDEELERDLEMWFRGAILMLAATANLEDVLFSWTQWHVRADGEAWQIMVLRLLLAIGVIESMPDEDIFCLLHRGPPKLKLTTRRGWADAWQRKGEVLRGLAILHLRRSSPVFVIMAVVFGGPPGDILHTVGWWCYGLAIGQYLIIALITQRDRITGLLEAFERKTDSIRQEIIAKGSAASAVVSDGEAGDPNLLPWKPGRHD